jgi:hypothetical protein
VPNRNRSLYGVRSEKCINLYDIREAYREKNTIVDEFGREVSNVIVEDFPTWTKYISWKFCRFVKNACGPFPDPMVKRAISRMGLEKNMSVSSEYKGVITQSANDAKSEILGIYSDQCLNPLHQSGCDIKGNITQGKKAYNISGCKSYNSVNVDTSFGDQWFRSVAEAIQKGFILSSTLQIAY